MQISRYMALKGTGALRQDTALPLGVAVYTTMKQSYKYRLYPNKQQDQALNRVVEIHRQIYNAALQERKDAWKRRGVSIYYSTQSMQLKPIREFDDDIAWLNFSSCQQTLRRLDKAYAAFFRRVKAGEKAGFPRFKGKGWFSSACYVYGDGVKLRDNKLYIQNVGLIRIFQHRPFPEGAEIKMVVIKRDKASDWYAIFQIEFPGPPPFSNRKPEVGIDMGLSYFASLSTGEQIDNPRWFRTAEKKLAVTQRKRSRTKRGSKRNRELKRQVARQHRHITNRRRDFQHKLSTRLVNEFGLIAVEKLNIKGLCRGFVSKSMIDAAWGQFLTFLAYKASSAGCQFIKANARHTSQTCPKCGCVVPKDLSERVHKCSDCGYTLPRDVAAAQVILVRGKARIESLRKGFLYLQVAESPRFSWGGNHSKIGRGYNQDDAALTAGRSPRYASPHRDPAVARSYNNPPAPRPSEYAQ